MNSSTIANAVPEAATLKAEILTLVKQYRALAPIEGGGDAASLAALVESLLDADLVGGGDRDAGKFEDRLAKLFGVREALLVNSGSSANLAAITALTSPRMGKLRLKRGDEVITVAAGSPSMVAALVQNQLAPVFVDLALPGFNVDVRQLQGALSPRTRAIALPHLHGNPFDLDAITMFAAFNNLLLVEDCRDALGATFGGRPVGCFGQFATASFHEGRQLSTGEGGAVLASSPLYRSIAESVRDRGSNLTASAMQAALGAARIEPLSAQLAERGLHAKALADGLSGLGELFILPESLRSAIPSWLELPIAIRESAPFSRDALVAALTGAGVIVRAYPRILPPPSHRQVGALPVTGFACTRGLLIRVQPDAVSIAGLIRSAVNDLGYFAAPKNPAS